MSWLSLGLFNDIFYLFDRPSLIIQGEKDEYGTLKQVENIIKQTKGQSTQLVLPNVKHTPHREVPGLVLGKVSDFIKKYIIFSSD